METTACETHPFIELPFNDDVINVELVHSHLCACRHHTQECYNKMEQVIDRITNKYTTALLSSDFFGKTTTTGTTLDIVITRYEQLVEIARQVKSLILEFNNLKRLPSLRFLGLHHRRDSSSSLAQQLLPPRKRRKIMTTTP